MSLDHCHLERMMQLLYFVHCALSIWLYAMLLEFDMHLIFTIVALQIASLSLLGGLLCACWMLISKQVAKEWMLNMSYTLFYLAASCAHLCFMTDFIFLFSLPIPSDSTRLSDNLPPFYLKEGAQIVLMGIPIAASFIALLFSVHAVAESDERLDF